MKNFKIIVYIFLFYIITLSFQNSDICPYNNYSFSLDDTCQFSAVIDGKAITLVEGNEKIRNGSNVIKNLKKQPDSSAVICQSYFYKYPAGQADISVNIGTFKFIGFKIRNIDFIHFFKIKKYNFSELAENGVEIIYHDKKYELWSSSQGRQDQSSFEITEIKSDSSNVKFKACFNCKLFNSEGEFILLEKGMFIGYFRNS